MKQTYQFDIEYPINKFAKQKTPLNLEKGFAYYQK